MARKHSKKFSQKSTVQQVLVSTVPASRSVVLNPTTDEYEVVNVEAHNVYKQGRALASTSTKGMRNTGGDSAGKKSFKNMPKEGVR
jgi:hypothetical protein